MKKAVLKRDEVCPFCWDKLECEGAHIIAQRNIPMEYDKKHPFTTSRSGTQTPSAEWTPIVSNIAVYASASCLAFSLFAILSRRIVSNFISMLYFGEGLDGSWIDP